MQCFCRCPARRRRIITTAGHRLRQLTASRIAFSWTACTRTGQNHRRRARFVREQSFFCNFSIVIFAIAVILFGIFCIETEFDNQEKEIVTDYDFCEGLLNSFAFKNEFF